MGSVIKRDSPGHAAQAFHFVGHLLEMTFAMMVGMVAGAAVFLTAVGMTVDEGLRRFPELFVLVIAFSMSVPMVAWMRHRGHSWRSCSEMAAWMIVPAIPLICLRLAQVITGPVCGVYCVLSIVAMVLVMLYRRSEYGGISTAAPIGPRTPLGSA
jgi:hypothetical protein